MRFIFMALAAASFTLLPHFGYANTGSAHAMGGSLAVVSASQSDMDTLIDRANAAAGGISNPDLGSAYEVDFFYQYRFKGSMFAVQVRPSFVWQSSSGTGGGEDYEYQVVGYTLFPILRMIPLENDFIKFFMQFGLGAGIVSGSIQEADASVDFSGSRLGMLAGVGAEFCFSKSHCASIEGNLRHLPIERNLASRASGTWRADSLTQAEKGLEVEINDRDLATTLSGIKGTVSYIFYF